LTHNTDPLMQYLHALILILTLGMLWNLQFIDLPVPRPPRQSFPHLAAAPPLTKGNIDIHAIRRRLRLLKQRACGPAC